MTAPPKEWYSRYREYRIAGFLVLVSAAVMIFSVFLPWLSGMNGFSLMAGDRDFLGNGNFLLSWGRGAMFFSGFWALLFAVLAAAGALLMFRRDGVRRILPAVSICAAATALGVFNLVIFFVKDAAFIGYDSGPGLWVFAIASFAGAVTAGTGS